MTARYLIISSTTDRLRITVYGLLTLAVMGCIGAAAIQADEHFKRQDLARQEASATWK